MGVNCAIGAVSRKRRAAANRGRKMDRRDAHILTAFSTDANAGERKGGFQTVHQGST